MIITKKMTEWCDEKWPREIWTKEESVQNTDLKKRLDRASIVEKMKPKNFSGGHLTRTQKAAGPGEESTRDHPEWIVKCESRHFRATWRYVFKILLIYGFYSSY